MQPTVLAKASLALLAAASLLSGCLLPRPLLFLEAFDAQGKPRQGFAPGEVPTLFCSVSPAQAPDSVITILRLPDRVVVRTIPAHSHYIVSQRADSDPDHPQPVRIEPPEKIVLAGLPAGHYAAELRVKENLADSLEFSTSEPSLSPDDLAAALRGGNPYPGGPVGRLDQLVNLTAGQRAAVTQIFADQNAALQTFTSPEDRMKKGSVIRQNARARIRTLLTPAQQAIYDATPQRLGGGSYHDPDNPLAAQRREVNASVTAWLKASPAIAARLGPIVQIAPVDGSSSFSMSGGSASALQGSERFSVQGGVRSETLTVHWKKSSVSAPITIARIVGSAGDVIRP
jgi:hypothetical protein